MSDLARFCARYGIDSMEISEDTGINGVEASLVVLSFRTGDTSSPPYRVSFKLLADAAGAHRVVQTIGPPPNCSMELTGAGRELGKEQIGGAIADLLQAIESRVKKIHREQEILNTRPVGQTFILAGETKFEVLADDGAGRLTIRIMRPDGDKEASLAANDLLDGLYTGLIRRP